ncbi:MAG TPA: formate/nitrite family transporter [Phototrophicaceae bacterium]|nr:formate/nitrite family transporter [Phototrophicaceae bacterium]
MRESLSRVDALLPAEIAQRAEEVGVKKAALDTASLLALAVLAGAFIALGAMLATVASAGAAGILPFGVTRLLAGLVFCLGLILVVLAGAELFTGNNLIVMAWASRKISTAALLRNWGIVYLGNFVGALATAVLLFLTRQYTFGNGAVGQTALSIANAKVNLDFVQAVALGIMCNALVCVAVWLTFGARTASDKILAILFPITAFVAAGFEHSIANMYFIPLGWFIKQFDPAFAANTGLDLTNLTPAGFLANLIPVTIGNIIGGVVMVAGAYWFIYLRKKAG